MYLNKGAIFQPSILTAWSTSSWFKVKDKSMGLYSLPLWLRKDFEAKHVSKVSHYGVLGRPLHEAVRVNPGAP